MRLRSTLAVLALFAACTPAARADTFYIYQGAPFQSFQTTDPFTGNATSDPGPVDGLTAVSGWFETPFPIPANYAPLSNGGDSINPVAWSFTDGVQTWDGGNPNGGNFFVSTDGNGNIVGWNIGFGFDNIYEYWNGPGYPYGGLDTSYNQFDPNPDEEDSSVIEPAIAGSAPNYSAENYGVPGTWTISNQPPSAVPEPPALTLLATGLLGLVAAIRRRLT